MERCYGGDVVPFGAKSEPKSRVLYLLKRTDGCFGEGMYRDWWVGEDGYNQGLNEVEFELGVQVPEAKQH